MVGKAVSILSFVLKLAECIDGLKILDKFYTFVKNNIITFESKYYNIHRLRIKCVIKGK